MKYFAMLIVAGLLIAQGVTPSGASASTKLVAGPTMENALAAEKELAQGMRTNDASAVCRLLDLDWALVTGNGEVGDGAGIQLLRCNKISYF